MGLLSTKKSTQTDIETTSATGQAAAGDNSQLLTGLNVAGDLTLLDAGAVNRALDSATAGAAAALGFADRSGERGVAQLEEAFGFSDRLAGRSFDLAGDSMDRGYRFAGDSMDRGYKFAGDAGDRAFDAYDRATEIITDAFNLSGEQQRRSSELVASSFESSRQLAGAVNADNLLRWGLIGMAVLVGYSLYNARR